MSAHEDCIVRPAATLEEGHSLWWPLMQNLGWNRASEDCATHYISSGKDGVLIVAPKSTPSQGEGILIPFTYDNATGWLGFFCINSGFRGKGWGAKLFQAGLDHFKTKGVAVAGLDAVEQQVATYARRGFVETDRVRLMQRSSLTKAPLAGGLARMGSLEELVDLATVPAAVLAASDLEHTGLQRTRLWTGQALLERDDVFGFAIVKEGKVEVLEGWVLVRGCELGFRVGPLYANSPERAAMLLRSAMKRVEDRDGAFIAETWLPNVQAAEVFRAAGWTDAGIDYHRMWLGGVAPKAQAKGGRAETAMYATFDAGEG